MRYRVHKHCTLPDCPQWVVSNIGHVDLYAAADWRTALDWTLARVTREALTRRDGPGWIDQVKWDYAAIPPFGGREALTKLDTLPNPVFHQTDHSGLAQIVAEHEAPVVARAQERAESFGEAFAQLMAKAQVVWPKPRFHESAPLVNAPVAGYVGEFATDECPEPAKNDGLTPIDPQYHLSGPGSFMLGDSSDDENR